MPSLTLTGSVGTLTEPRPTVVVPDQSRFGVPVYRIEDAPLLVGQGSYLDDIDVPDALHVAFVRSNAAHAVIKSIDRTAARAVAGVRAVLTLDDLRPALSAPRMPLGASGGAGKNTSTPFVLATDEVAYVGEPIVMVVAESRYVAEDAAALVAIEYDALDVVSDARLACTAGSPLVRRELTSNVLSTQTVGYGDVEAAFAQADMIFRDDLWQHRGCGISIEGRGVLAQPNSADGSLRVWSSTQMPNDLCNTLGEVLGLDTTRLRVTAPDIGGGFGPKYCIYPEELAIPAAALLLKRTLKWSEDRRETFISSIQERDQYWFLEIAVARDARILGMRGRLVHDQGAYAPKPVNLPYNSATALTGPYVVPAYLMSIDVVLTNKVPVSSVRGAGYPQAVFAMERMIDLVAVELGLDRAEVRSRNLIPADKMPYTKPLKARSGAGMVYDSGDYPATQAQALAVSGWQAFAERQRAAFAEGRYIGIGMANAVKGTGRGPFESGKVEVSTTGQITVFTGAVAMGQGLATALAQICAREFGVAPSAIKVIAGDTGSSPLGLGGFASRQLVTAGSSVHLAAKAVAAKARRLASDLLSLPEERLELRDGSVLETDGDKKITLAELARILRGAPGYAFPDALTPGLWASDHWRTDALTYANACHVAEVEVDLEAFDVTLRRYVAVSDAGTLVNPMIVDGQIVGGIVHGIGNALFELMGYDENAQPLTTNLGDYLVPTSTVVPPVETFYRETPAPHNPIGAKGVGELGTVPVAAAIISAVEDALSPFKLRISNTPILPQKLYELVMGSGEQRSLFGAR